MKPMKRSQLLSLLIVIGLAGAFGVLVARRYMARPFFADSFCLIGQAGLLSWSRGPSMDFDKESMGLDHHLYGECDVHDRVLLLVPYPETGDSMEWVPDLEPISEWLRVRSLKRNVVKQIEWRRDCMIYLDRDGTPTYVSLPIHEFGKALATPGMKPVSDLVRGLLRSVPEAAGGNSRRP